MTEETETRVNKTGDTVRLETKIKRGTGTRDQDTIKVKVYGDNPDDAAQMLHDTVVAVGTNGTIKALRGTQPTKNE